MRRLLVLATFLLTLSAAGCATIPEGGSSAGSAAPAPAGSLGEARTPGGAPSVSAEVTGDPHEDVPSALRDIKNPALPEPLVDPARIISGGPPPDGIPPIDSPRFEKTASVDWLADDEAVIALTLGDDRRAYPVQVMMWHEIVNDVVDGRPVAVTYCPLCNSALAFDRQVGERLLTFGTSGRLYLSALVMYDRQTESLWSQVERTAIAGVLTGTELDLIPVTMARWADWRASNPEGLVLSRDTGFARDYGRNPYVDYDTIDNEHTFLDQSVDGRYPAKERVVTFPGAREPVAVLAAALADVGVAEVKVDGRSVVLFSAPGLASALQDYSVADGAPILATGAFLPAVDGRELTFRSLPEGDAAPPTAVAVDDDTGSRWDIFGLAIDGPLAGTTLELVPHLDTFWFAQAAFEPDTVILPVTASPS